MNQIMWLLVIVIVLLEWRKIKGGWKWLWKGTKASRAIKPRVMKPRSPKDCPKCQKSKAIESIISKPSPTLWIQKKGHGGRKKTLSTQNYFCSNPECEYYRITDEQIHALVAYGRHGKYEEIRDLKCQACGKKFTIRKHTVLYRLRSECDFQSKTHSKIICLVLGLLALGMDASALEEALEIRESTLRTRLSRSGEHGHKLHERFMVGLELLHLQLDELYGYVKQSGHAAAYPEAVAFALMFSRVARPDL